jgi:hypothetical protein
MGEQQQLIYSVQYPLQLNISMGKSGTIFYEKRRPFLDQIQNKTLDAEEQ